ncbi:NACHT domain-containing protein [Streptomyces sp. NPDC048594]|uniref:NACHT domain-containing protein n=1 Tax=Streptomyces sp. NPDC048594 TaxID=3365575 RepID=UPI0037148FCF
MKFDLYRLGPREFENLTQVIAITELGPDVAVYGAGSDGGREATQNESTECEPYVLVQAKHKETPGSAQSEATWLIKELRKEFKDWRESEKRKHKPDQFILATNVTLSATPRTGGMDRVAKALKEECERLGVSRWIIWHGETFNRFLEKNPGIRTSYAAWILPGDILSFIYNDITRKNSNVAGAIRSYTSKELLEDRYANLDQAGSADDRTVPLADVFFDVPIGLSQERYVQPSGARCLETLIAACNNKYRPTEQPQSQEGALQFNRFVLVGGPGQGKSTVSQFLCQLYRAQLVKDTVSMRNSEVRAAVTQINEQAAREELIPNARRWPINIPLTRLADELAQEKCHSLLDYIAQRVSEASGTRITVADIKDWLENFPWLIVLDGLDEVPGSSNRDQVLAKISAFQLEADELDADVVVVATTRPQGYTDEFSPKNYVHYYLTALDTTSALAFGRKLADARHGSSSDRVKRLMVRLTRAAAEPSTAHLMTTPLQVTIMAVLLDRVGKAPKDRFTLFADYYRVIFERELEKEGAANNLLRDHKIDIDSIHADVGLLLQTRSERSGETESRITVRELDTIIADRLVSEGHAGEELHGLTDAISRAATHRLVFLVPSRDDEVSFEIRSLQEFWAADALMNCNEVEIGRRLRMMAVSSHWRNVLLFALGNIFATRRNNLRDSVVALVSELNAPSEEFGIMPRRTLTGSLLAVEILNDGMVRAPRYESVLVEESLKLLALPYSEHILLLADCISERGMEIARDHVSLMLKSGSELNDATLAYLGGRSAQGDQWAFQRICEAFERADRKRREGIFRLSWAYQVPSLFHVAAMAVCDPESTLTLARSLAILTAHSYTSLMEPKGCSTAPQWLPSLVALFGRTSLANRPYKRIRFGPVSVQVCSVTGYPSALDDCLSNGLPSQHWLAEVAIFCQNPSTNGLAEVIRKLGPYSDEYSQVASYLPWIIYYGVQLYQEHGATAIEMIEDGHLGRLNDWVALEARWAGNLEPSALTTDFEEWRTERTEFIPLPACELSLVRNPAAYIGNLDEIVRRCEQVADSKQRARMAHVCFRAAVSLHAVLPTSELAALLDRLQEVQGSTELETYQSLGWVSDLPDGFDWTDLLDRLGRHVTVGHAWVPHPLPLELIAAWVNDFSRVGLARLAASQGHNLRWDSHAMKRVELEWENVKSRVESDNITQQMLCIVASMSAPPRDREEVEARLACILSASRAGVVSVDFLANVIALNCDEVSASLLLRLADSHDITGFDRQALYERMVQLQTSAETGIEYRLMRPS